MAANTDEALPRRSRSSQRAGVACENSAYHLADRPGLHIVLAPLGWLDVTTFYEKRVQNQPRYGAYHIGSGG